MNITDMTKDEIHTALRLDAFYQALGRTSIRDRDNNDRKIFIVPSNVDAEYIHGLFEGSTLHGQLGNAGSLTQVKTQLKRPNLKGNPEYERLVRAKEAARLWIKRNPDNQEGIGSKLQLVENIEAEIDAMKGESKLIAKANRDDLYEKVQPRGLRANNTPVRNDLKAAVDQNIKDYISFLNE